MNTKIFANKMIIAIIGKIGSGKNWYVQEKEKGKNIIVIDDFTNKNISYQKTGINGKENIFVLDDIDIRKYEKIIKYAKKHNLTLYILQTKEKLGKIKKLIDKIIYLNYNHHNLPKQLNALCSKTNGDIRKAKLIFKYNSDCITSIQETLAKVLSISYNDKESACQELIGLFDLRTQKFILNILKYSTKNIDSLMILNSNYSTKSKYKEYLIVEFIYSLKSTPKIKQSFTFRKNNWIDKKIDYLKSLYPNLSARECKKYLKFVENSYLKSKKVKINKQHTINKSQKQEKASTDLLKY